MFPPLSSKVVPIEHERSQAQWGYDYRSFTLAREDVISALIVVCAFILMGVVL